MAVVPMNNGFKLPKPDKIDHPQNKSYVMELMRAEKDFNHLGPLEKLAYCSGAARMFEILAAYTGFQLDHAESQIDNLRDAAREGKEDMQTLVGIIQKYL